MLRWNNDYNHGAHPEILKALAEIVLKFFFKDPKANINVILSLVSALVQIIQYLFYIGYLGKARKMLRA